MLKFTVRLMLILVCCVIPWFAVADEPDDLYQIELIFFEHLDSKRYGSEEWPKYVGKLDTSTAVAVDSNSIPQTNFLDEEAKIIKRSKDQRFIQLVAWDETLLSNFRSTPVYIKAGKNNEEVQAVMDIRPTRNVFNVNIDIIYKNQDGKEFRVARELKLKNKQMYYIDHPIFGAMVLITKVPRAG